MINKSFQVLQPEKTPEKDSGIGFYDINANC